MRFLPQDVGQGIAKIVRDVVYSSQCVYSHIPNNQLSTTIRRSFKMPFGKLIR